MSQRQRLLVEIGVLVGVPLLAGAFVLWSVMGEQRIITLAPRQAAPAPVASGATFSPPPIKPHLPDVDLFIKDTRGNVVAKDTEDAPDCRLEVTIPSTGDYQVVIDNPAMQHPARPMGAALAKVTILEKDNPEAAAIAFQVNVAFNDSHVRTYPFRGGVTYLFTIETEVGQNRMAPPGPAKNETPAPPNVAPAP